MKVLLLADPPAGDKVEQKLRSLGIETEYARGRKGTAQLTAIHSDLDWVICMNAHVAGGVLKEKARKLGAKFASIPPSWSSAEVVLRDNHFFADLFLKASKHTAAAPLTTKPFAALLTQEKDMPPKTNGATAHQSPAPLPPQPEPAKLAIATPPTEDNPKSPEVALRLARETWTRDPNISAQDVVDDLRRLNFAINRTTTTAIYDLRRELRVARGLPPHGGSRRPVSTRGRRHVIMVPDAPALVAAAPEPPPPPTTPPLATPPPDDGLPAPLLAAAQLLAEEIRKADLVGWIQVSDQGEVSGEVSTRRRVSVRAKV